MTTTDEQPAPTGALEIPDLKATDDFYSHPDVSLQHMADVANHLKAGLGVVLITSGGVISGRVISAEEFYEWADKSQKAAATDDPEPIGRKAGEAISELFFGQVAAAHRTTQESRDNNVAYRDYVRHIHLADAKLTTGTNQPTLELGHLRVLLSHVSAWTIGGFTH